MTLTLEKNHGVVLCTGSNFAYGRWVGRGVGPGVDVTQTVYLDSDGADRRRGTEPGSEARVGWAC